MDLLQGDNYSLFLKNDTYNTDININFNMNFNLKDVAKGSLKNSVFGDCSKMIRCKARKNRIARRIFKYVDRCGLQRNTADHGALQGMSAL